MTQGPALRTMMCAFRGGVLVEVHSELPPSDREWDELVELARTQNGVGLGCLVVSDGGAPNAVQRRNLAAVPLAGRVPVAVVTPSLLARGAVTALAWLGHNIRAFSPSEIDSALAFAKVPIGRAGEIIALVADLKCQLLGAQLSDLTGGSGDGAEIAHVVARERVRQVRERISAATGASAPP